MRPFGRDQNFTETNDVGVRVFIRRNAAAYGDEVSAPPEPISYGFSGNHSETLKVGNPTFSVPKPLARL